MKYHGIKPVYNVWLSKDDGKYFGPGVAMLIEGVKRTGSLSSAAKEIGMAYSKAWRIVRTAESVFGCKMLATSTGGKNGGGASLTPEAVSLLAAYDGYCAEVGGFAAQRFSAAFGAFEKQS